MTVAFIGYIIAYHTYGRYLSKKIFGLNNQIPVPSITNEDGCDYVPTQKGVVFGHHFTSIAGTGPIVGPAIGVIWGWVPAFLWVFLGAIVMGAVHDLGALVISLRHGGKSISDIAADYINPRVRIIFFLIVFFAVLIVIAIFGLVIAIIFSLFPSSVFPVWMQIPIALGLGYAVYQKKAPIFAFTAIAIVCMYLTVGVGKVVPITMPISISEQAYHTLKQTIPLQISDQIQPLVHKIYLSPKKFESDFHRILGQKNWNLYKGELLKTAKTYTLAGIPATGLWTVLLLIYAFIASTLPVTKLLQPRDYINAWQLFLAMGLMTAGAFASGFAGNLPLSAPAFNLHPQGAPSLIPFLFITIACGAISGFHCLVSSGTSSKQLAKETDAQFVGYGSMLLESALAVLVLVAVAAGIGMAYETAAGDILTGRAAWNHHYASWMAVSGLGAKINAVVIGSANMMGSLGIPKSLSVIIIGVFIASFAGTTLDSATRIQRYVISELFSKTKASFLSGKYTATAIAVLSAALLAFGTGASGKGALKLWPLFGAVNQLLAALAFLVLTLFLQTKKGYAYLITLLPCLFMLSMTLWGAGLNQNQFFQQSNWMLFIINGIILFLAVWMMFESSVMFIKRLKS